MLKIKVPINPKIIFLEKEYLRFSEQNAEKIFDFGSNLDFLWIVKVGKNRNNRKHDRVEDLAKRVISLVR